MKTVTCDSCGKELSFNHLNLGKIERPANLTRYSEVRVGNVEVLPFRFSVEVLAYQFDCTNFHACANCVIDAIAATFAQPPTNEPTGKV